MIATGPASPPPRGPRTIRTRILLAFALSLIASSTALGHGLLQLQAIGRSLTALDRSYLPLSRVAAELEAIARQMDREQDRFTREPPLALAGHRANAQFYSRGLKDALDRGRSLVQADTEAPTPATDRAALAECARLLKQIEAERAAYDTAFAAWADTTEASATPSGAHLADLDTRRTLLLLQVGQLAQLVDGRVTLLSRLTARAQTTALRVSGALAALAVALSGVLAAAALVALRPIGELTGQVQRLAQGDYAGRLAVRGADEVTVLAREFNAMAEAVSERDRRLQERARALDALSLRLQGIVDTIRAGLVLAEGSRVALVNPAASALWSVHVGDRLPTGLSDLPAGRHDALAVGERLFDLDVVPINPTDRLIVGEDVTQRERDRARLARSQRLALVGQMLAQITHEVRNPLNAMSLNADLLHDELEDAEHRAMMDTIAAEIRRLEALTARYLELSRGRRPELESVDARAIVEQVIHTERPSLDQAGVAVRVLGGRPGPRELDADALRRALRNLLRNAVEADATTIHIAVDPTPDRVRIRVIDDGPGMGPDALRQAFEPFFTTKPQGTGLGLAISRQELEDVGGTLHAESVPGHGSTFTLNVPAPAA